MKIIVTHASPDLDAITSAWLIKRFLAGWENAEVRFVPAGEKLKGAEVAYENFLVHDAKKLKGSSRILKPASAHSENFVGSSRHMAIEKIDGNEIIHVDTGLGPLDHHQTADDTVCAASLTFGFVQRTIKKDLPASKTGKMEAVERMVKLIVNIDHFKEVFWENPTADHHEFSLMGILEGLKLQKPDNDLHYLEFVMQCLDALVYQFQNKIWAEKQITNAHQFKTRWGKGIGFETINDAVIPLALKMGFVLAVRKNPQKGYVRIKAKPSQVQNKGVDLTLAYEQLKKMDPQATWFLHVSKKMLLNGSVKNPKMKPTKLSLDDIIKVLEKL